VESRARILIVDDDAILRDTMRRVLNAEKYQTSMAETGFAALELLVSERFDLVLLDANMPGMNGLEVCQRIKGDPQLAGVGVIILSGGLVESEYKSAGLESGADDYITRPVPSRELLARVQAVLRVRTAEQA